MRLTDLLQVTSETSHGQIIIPDSWLYAIISTLLALVVWGLNRWVSRLDKKMDKTDECITQLTSIVTKLEKSQEEHDKRIEEHDQEIKELQKQKRRT